tara:strand:- start:678 stop:1364 length:687 start_codon:yes stop_codon:yes gene_type:complete
MLTKKDRLVYGTYKLPSNYDDFLSIVGNLFSSGVEWIDTAPMYNKGLSEKWIGKITKKFPFKVATKGGKFYSGNKLKVSLNYSFLSNSFENSLNILSTDKLDAFFVHNYDNSTTKEELASTLEKLRSNYSVNKLGVSNFPPKLWQFLAKERLIEIIQFENNDICDNSKQVIDSKKFNLECWTYRLFRKGKRLRTSSVEDIIELELNKSDNQKIIFGATKPEQINFLKY